MKKIAILSLCAVLLLAVCAFSASASLTVTSVYNKDNPTFGGSNQDACNPNADDEDDEEVYATTAVNLANNGSSAVTVASVVVTPKTTSSGQTFALNELNITLPAAVEVLAGNSAALQLKARIPADLDAVDSYLREAAFNVADIALKDGGGTTLATFSAYMQRENHLRFDKVYVRVGDSSDSVDDEDSVKDIKPGDKVEVEATAENTFDDRNDDVDIEDVELLVLIDDRDLDVDEDADMGDIGSDEKETETIKFDVDEDCDDDTYLMEITIEGEDEHGAKHGERINIDFEVEKNRHEIKIQEINVVPAQAKCGETVQVKVEVANIGKSDEDEVTLRISAIEQDLGIDQLMPNIELDEGDATQKTFDMTLPKNTPEGAQAFTLITYYDFNEESDREAFAVTVLPCDEEDEEEDEPATSTGSQDVSPPATTSTGGTATAQPVDDDTDASPGPVTTVRDSGDGFRDSTLYILLLVLAIIIIAVVGAVLLVKVLVVK